MVKNESLIEFVEETCARAKEVNSTYLNYVKQVIKRLAGEHLSPKTTKIEHYNIRGAKCFSDDEAAK